ncbi:MAG: DNA alkylation repair protein [Cyanobacteria bacterium J06600_6]
MAQKKHKEWFDRDLAQLLAQKIAEVYPEFNSQGFISDIDLGVDKLELKARLSYFSDRFHNYLPADYPQAITILVAILGAENPQETGMMSEYYWTLPIATFIEEYGLEHYAESIDAIAEVTKRSTGEFAIRPYLKAEPTKTLQIIQQWSLADNFHLRRLASEGARTRLPWATKLAFLIEDPQPVLPILENLKDDPIRFVQRSVGNHLNDILKDNYDFGMDVIRDWLENASPARKWIIKHALRKQAKDGNLDAIKLRQSL